MPALAHRITLRPELWIQRVRAEDVVRDCLERCPAPSASAMGRTASPRLRGYAALMAAALMAALITGRPELAVLATPFLLLVAVALAAAPLAVHGELRLERDRALEGEQLTATLAVVNHGAGARVRRPSAGRRPAGLRPGDDRDLARTRRAA